MAGSNTDWYINSVPKDLEIYTSNGDGTWINQGNSLDWSNHAYVRFIDSAGKNMTRYCVPIESVPFSRIAYIFTGVNNYNDVSDSWSVNGMETKTSSMTVEKAFSPSIGNIPMGELTFNGVQSVTYNGTDYTKLVVDGTSYPPPLISFSMDRLYEADATYQAEEGMTWAEWLNSKYNIPVKYKSVNDTYIRCIECGGKVYKSSDTGVVVKPSDIIENTSYFEMDGPLP